MIPDRHMPGWLPVMAALWVLAIYRPAFSGDIVAARVYVVFPSALFWRTRAVSHIWTHKLPVGESLPNAFTSNAMMVAVESGNGKAGRSVREERNLYGDSRRLFGKEPPEIGAVAIMTDTDNTGGEAVAWYGDITLGPAR